MQAWEFLLLFSCAISLMEICRKLNKIKEAIEQGNYQAQQIEFVNNRQLDVQETIMRKQK